MLSDQRDPRHAETVTEPNALAENASSSLTYEGYYGLGEKPFSLAADPKFLFKSPSHEPAFDRLLAGIRRREGLIVLSGEVGTGKTTLCRAVLSTLDRRTFASFIPDPFVTREDLLKMLLVDFGVVSIDDVKSGRLKGASRPDLSYPLYEFLNALVPLQAFAVLIIDEAQHLPLPLLEEIRILSDLEGREKLLQVVLIGQPELRSNLKRPEMRQVDQRVSVRCDLEPLQRADVDGYVRHRLDVAAGGTCIGVRFTSGALDAVYSAANGTPRLINRICDGALHQGWMIGVTTIDANMVVTALEDLGVQESSSHETPARADLPAPTLLAAPRAASPSRPAAPIEPETPDESQAVHEFDSEASLHRQRKIQPISLPAVAAVVLFVLVSATLGVTAWYGATRDAIARATALPALPAKPRLPIGTLTALVIQTPPAAVPETQVSTGPYIIHVASFESGQRAAYLVTRLSDAGYQAYYTKVDLGDQQLWQVIVGAYDTFSDAQADLGKIRSIPGYDDARLKTTTAP